jgi:hypothetical protein
MGMLDSTYAYCAALEKRGYVKLGGGMFSQVFGKGNCAIKVGHSDDWPEYVEWATQAGFAGTFAPKVYSLKFHRGFYRGFYVAVMERLVCTMAELKIVNDYCCNNRYEDAYEALQQGTGRRFKETVIGFDDLRAFGQLVNDAGFSDDMHDGNVMLRSDGQIVLTDPSSHRSDQSRLRIKRGSVTTPSM